MAWTEERIALLAKYWQEGRSASQIAEALGEGLTRNAVIGKAHRLGLSSRPSPVKAGAESGAEADKKGRKGAAPGPQVADSLNAEGGLAAAEPAPEPAVLHSPPESAAPEAIAAASAPAPAQPARKAARGSGKTARVTLLDLTDRICKWPIGHPDEPDFHFCGKPVNPGFPYCGEHCLVAYQSQLARRDRPAGPPPPFRPNL
ncbi:GcrA family cell cycle regulator, partial [Thermaurantiacus sp.]